jgi:peptidoglycan/LPS O-acetylase OafA/YrhL
VPPATATQTDSSKPPLPTRIPALDGIRGLAICLVLVWHGFLQYSLPNHPQIASIVSLGRLLWSGVDLFFVLSGFLIGGILLDAVTAQHYFAPFYIRRAYRILPLYAAVLLLVLTATCLLKHMGASGLFVDARVPLWYYPTFLQNFWMARHGAFGSYTLGPTWSLAVEEQFYLTLPVIIRYVSRPRLWWIVGSMFVAAPLLRILLGESITHGALAGYVLMPCRADALGLGILAALIKRTPAVSGLVYRLRAYLYVAFGSVAAGLMALLLSRFEPGGTEGFGVEYSLLAVFYFLFLMSVLTNRKLEAALSIRPLRYVGTIAYGLYLLHRPFIVGFQDLVRWVHPIESGWLSLLASISGICFATAAAALSWEYLEKPLIKRGHKYGYCRKTGTPATDDGLSID